MAELDPELRDKIIETHTLVKRIDEDQKEHKAVVNARLRDQKLAFERHQQKIDDVFDKHDGRISSVEDFRTRALVLAGGVAGLGAVVIQLAMVGIKKIWGA